MEPRFSIPSWFVDSFPSFAYTSGLIFLELSLIHKPKNISTTCLRWLTIAVGFEFLQVTSIIGLSGTFDTKDIIAIFLGTIFAYIVGTNSNIRLFSRPQLLGEKSIHATLLSIAAFMNSATSFEKNSCHSGITVNQIQWSQPIPITNHHRVVLYNSSIFISEKSKGIHVIDNSDKNNPTIQGFIEIPGNSEIAIKDGFLYANSHGELVTIDINQLPSIRVLNPPMKPMDSCSNIPPPHAKQIEESTSVDERPPLAKITCIFENNDDACIFVTADSSSNKTIYGCRATNQIEEAHNCEITIPQNGQQIVEYTSVCGQNHQGLERYDHNLAILDFRSNHCNSADDFEENIPYFRAQCQDYITLYGPDYQEDKSISEIKNLLLIHLTKLARIR